MVYNTGETDKDLKAKYNPDDSVLRKAQLRMLDMLIYIDRVCKEQNIEYCLDSGNVLGAVRHGGFIPWDDDVDIILKKKDYDRLCKFLLENPHPQYVLQSPETDRYFANHWNVLRDLKSEYIQDSKIHNLRKYRGMQIDIFPIETNVNPLLHKVANYFHWRITDSILIRLPRMGMVSFYIERKLIIPVLKGISKIFSKSRKDIYSYAYGLPWQKEYHENVLFPTRNIKFEGYNFPAPNKLDDYLKEQYGDYMKLPSKDNRDHHKATYVINE